MQRIEHGVYCVALPGLVPVGSSDWKLILYPAADRRQIFDLNVDPFELVDVSATPQNAEVTAVLLAKLNTWQKQAGDPLPESSKSR